MKKLFLCSICIDASLISIYLISTLGVELWLLFSTNCVVHILYTSHVLVHVDLHVHVPIIFFFFTS